MTDNIIPTPEELRKLLRYEPETGKLFWLQRPDSMFKSQRDARAWNTRYSGKEAFTSCDSHGYHRGSILNHDFLAHRIIWVIETGNSPHDEIDHVNGNIKDNRISNLRQATRFENAKNTRIHYNNKSGCKGVYWNTMANKWHVQIVSNKIHHYLGVFDNLKDAYKAYADASIKFHGEFSRLK